MGDERKLTGFPVHCTAPRANQAKVAKGAPVIAGTSCNGKSGRLWARSRRSIAPRRRDITLKHELAPSRGGRPRDPSVRLLCRIDLTPALVRRFSRGTR